MIAKLTGPVHVWKMFDKVRTFGEVVLPFALACEYVMAVRYNALTGKGQQREIVESNLRKIKAAMKSDDFTPTPIAANISSNHNVVIDEAQGTFSLEVSSHDPLLQTDGGHRFEAMNRIVEELESLLDGAKNDSEKERLERWLEQVQNAPVVITIYFDGEPQRDFVNLQMGRSVDATHLLSLKLQQKLVDEPAMQLAFKIAKLLNKQEGSPFHNSIRFDSRGVAPLPINSLCARGSSDLGTSLVGLARVGLSAGKDASWLASVVISTYKALQKEEGFDSELLEYGKVLTPLANGGKKGQATMLIGLAVCLAYRLANYTSEELESLVIAAEQTLNIPVNGNLSGPVKRKLLGQFAATFFADLKDVERHDAFPIDLLKLLSSSTFGAEPLPKKKKKKTSNLPDVDSDVVEETPAGDAIHYEDDPWDDAAVCVDIGQEDPWCE